MILKNFTVHSAVVGAIEVDSVVDGAKHRAQVSGAIVELVANDGSGSMTLRLPGASMTDVESFLGADTVTASFAAAAQG